MEKALIFIWSLIFGTALALPQQGYQVGRNPCYFGNGQLYHTFPGDEMRYIQCSQWGQAYVRSCGVGKVWKQSLNACIKQSSLYQIAQDYRGSYTDDQYANYNYINDYLKRILNFGNAQYDYGDFGDKHTRNHAQEQQNSYANYPQYDPSNTIDAHGWSADTPSYGKQNSLWNRYNIKTNSLDNGQIYRQPMTGFSNTQQDGTINQHPGFNIYGSGSQTRSKQNILLRNKHDHDMQDTQYSVQPSVTIRSDNNPNLIMNPTYTMPTNTRLTDNSKLMLTSHDANPRQYNPRAENNYLWNKYATNWEVSPQFKSFSPQMNVITNPENLMHDNQKDVSKRTHYTSIQSNNNVDNSRMKNVQRQAPSTSGPLRSFDVPEICKDTEIRYIASPNDFTHFYECVKGTATVKSCPDDQVWVHPLRKCVDLNDHSNTIPSHNPCVGSDLKFHPYPADPSKYVECQSWYRVYVWKCKEGLWTQDIQQCEENNRIMTGQLTEKSYVPNKKIATPVSQNNDHSQSYCDNSTFYYKYNDNPAKYIQCDEFGRWFLKDCPKDMIWDDSLKSCVKMFSIGMSYEKEVSRDIMNTASRQLPENFDGTPQSYPCPGNYAWDVTKNKCVAISLSDYLPPCPRGYMWDPNVNGCIMYINPSAVEEFPDAEYAKPNCRDNQMWDPIRQMCIPKTVEHEHQNMLLEVDPNNVNLKGNMNEEVPNVNNQYQGVSMTNTVPVYSGASLCNDSSGQFYFAFPGKEDDHWFIQCDAFGTMYTQSCGLHRIWNDDIKSCVHHLTETDYGNTDNGNYKETGYRQEGNNQRPGTGNVCKDNPDVHYQSYPTDRRMFIMCHNLVGSIMSCPYGSRWQQEFLTCNWP